MSPWSRPGAKIAQVESCMITSTFYHLPQQSTETEKKSCSLRQWQCRVTSAGVQIIFFILNLSPCLCSPGAGQTNSCPVCVCSMQGHALCTNKDEKQQGAAHSCRLTPQWWTISLVMHIPSSTPDSTLDTTDASAVGACIPKPVACKFSFIQEHCDVCVCMWSEYSMCGI